MKKLFVMALAMASIALVSCGGKSGAGNGSDSTAVDSAAAAPAEVSVFEGGSVYHNAEFGYSISIPAQMKLENEQKNGPHYYTETQDFPCEIIVFAKNLNEPGTEEMLKKEQESTERIQNQVNKQIKSELNGSTYTYVGVDEWGKYSGKYMMYQGTKLLTVSVTYKKDEAKLNEILEKMVSSLKVE